MEEFHKADSALDEATSKEGIVGKGPFAGIGTIHFLNVFWLAGDVGDFGRDLLHAGGHFVGRDPGLDFGIADGLEVAVIEFVDGVNDGAAVAFFDSFGIGEKENGIAHRAELDAIVDGGEGSRS